MSKTPEEMVGELSVKLKDATDGLKKFAEDAEKEIKATGALSKETKTAVDAALVKLNDVEARLAEAEQKLTRRGKAGADAEPTLGRMVSEDEQVKAFMARGGRGSVRVDVKAITSAGNSAGPLLEELRVPGIVTPPQRRLVVRDLLTPGRISTDSLRFVKELGFTNNARPVTEGALKPESNITFEAETATVATIAHWVQASRQILADAPMLESYIDGRLRYGLAFKEEDQLLNGDGTGENLLGLLPQATAFAPDFVPANMTMIDEIRLAMLQAVLAEYPATGIVLNPIDWARIELTKDEEGRYIFANPRDLAGPSLWGLPVVPTQAMAEDTFLAGAFRLGAQIFDREDANVQISTEDRDNFVKNMVTLRAEERLALAVYRPEAFITGEFTASGSAT